MIDRDPKDPSPEVPTIREIMGIYENAGRILHNNSVRLFPDHMGLAEEENSSELLAHVLLMGENAIGISLSHAEGADGFTGATTLRVSLLPIGESAGFVKNNQSSETLATIDLAALTLPRQDNTIRSWEDVPIERAGINAVTGQDDRTMSREHAVIRVLPDGSIEVHDRSSNGTAIVSGKDMLADESVGGFALNDRERIVRFVKPLNDKPYLWTASTAGKRIIDPY